MTSNAKVRTAVSKHAVQPSMGMALASTLRPQLSAHMALSWVCAGVHQLAIDDTPIVMFAASLVDSSLCDEPHLLSALAAVCTVPTVNPFGGSHTGGGVT